uniref:DELTA-thalatoxin-Avl1a-like n=1 Tax=Astyanax mexicanus TaxID=7994 RepID=A0A3B1KDV9_ASTMX
MERAFFARPFMLARTAEPNSEDTVNTTRNVTIKIKNSSRKYILEDPRQMSYTYSGSCSSDPKPTIRKNKEEVCSFSKTPNTACGAVGAMTYQIISDDRKCIGELAIMFSVPYNYNFYENWFALGVYAAGISCNYDLYYQMYNESGPFTRTNGTGCSIDYSKNTVLVVGTMSPQSKSVILVELCDVKGNK